MKVCDLPCLLDFCWSVARIHNPQFCEHADAMTSSSDQYLSEATTKNDLCIDSRVRVPEKSVIRKIAKIQRQKWLQRRLRSHHAQPREQPIQFMKLSKEFISANVIIFIPL